MTRRRVVVVGSANMDLVVAGPSLPAPGETVTGGSFYTACGGKGANQAVAAARAADRETLVSFVAAVGNDEFGRSAVAGFKADGIDCGHVFTIDDAPTGVACVIVGPMGENMIVVAPGANERLLPAHVAKAASVIAKADILLLQLETPMQTVEAAVDLAARHGVRVMLNPAPAPANPLHGDLLQKVSILTPNETELAALIGHDPSGAAIKKLAAVLREALIVTEGKRGARVVCKDGSETRAGTFSVKAVDTVGAGDAFSGALGLALAEGRDMEQALGFASAAAAISVTRRGAQPSMPKREEILMQLREQ